MKRKSSRVLLSAVEKKGLIFIFVLFGVCAGVLEEKILCNSDLIGVQSSTASDKWIMHTGNCVPCNQVQ